MTRYTTVTQTWTSRQRIAIRACGLLFLGTSVLYYLGAETPVTESVKEYLENPWWDGGECSPTASAADKRTDVGGTCGYRAWAAGGGQKVVSLSLYGDQETYWQGLDTMLTQVRDLYPGWKVRLYTDARWRKGVLCPLLRRHAHLFVCDVEGLPPLLGNVSFFNPTLWRIMLLGDPQVEIMIVRDTDSPISPREVAAVEDWLSSNKTFHTMRDHPDHFAAILAGMWGARWNNQSAPKGAQEMAILRNQILERDTGETWYGIDQMILMKALWPVAVNSLISHDSYLCQVFPHTVPWPTQRQDGFYVGAPLFRPKLSNSSLQKPCPVECRPETHKDWLYC